MVKELLAEYESLVRYEKAVSEKKLIYKIIKRIFDICVSFIGVLFLIPVTAILKIAYMLTGDFHTIFFTQKRIGLNGKEIKIFKYRSMVPNGELVLEKLMKENPAIKKEYEENKKLENDPRITKLGKFIRKFSIDELPQLINVFIGDMSLIGPRPYLFREKTDMKGYYNNIIKVKPGITGLWQVSGRSDISFNNRCKLESFYALNSGLRMDVKIFIKTFSAVLCHKGAK